MLKRFRFLVSANLVAVLFISTLILSKSDSVKACPPPEPKTLLELYLQSDLIFVADITDEKDGKVLIDDKNYYRVEIIRNLKISSALKGSPPRNFVFTDSEYRDKKPVEPAADDESELNYEYFHYGYKGYSELKSGQSYLFFFSKNTETNEFFLTDQISGYKKLSDADLFIHKKRINELKSIIRNKENQLDEITRWLIRLIEEPSTRWDGVYDLNASFESVEYNDENEDEDEDTSETKEAFVIDKNFSSSTPEIARNLSGSQKEYISTLTFSSFHQEIDSGFSRYSYNLSNLAGRWDKSRLAMYAFSFLQTADKTDTARVNSIMEYISSVLEDGKLYQIASDYPVVDSSEQAEEITGDETEIVETETVNESENTIVEVDESTATGETDESTVSETEQNNDASAEKSTESEEKTAKLTIAQKRQKILQDFINRYEYLLARGFPVEAEPEVELAQK